jgi:hypothetical protein
MHTHLAKFVAWKVHDTERARKLLSPTIGWEIIRNPCLGKICWQYLLRPTFGWEFIGNDQVGMIRLWQQNTKKTSKGYVHREPFVLS